LYTKCVSLMVTLSDTNSFNIINAWNISKCLSNKRISNMSHVHAIQEKKVTIKAFKKLKYIVYRLDRDNVGQYLIC
jgi:hypothetical protein